VEVVGGVAEHGEGVAVAAVELEVVGTVVVALEVVGTEEAGWALAKWEMVEVAVALQEEGGREAADKVVEGMAVAVMERAVVATVVAVSAVAERVEGLVAVTMVEAT